MENSDESPTPAQLASLESNVAEARQRSADAHEELVKARRLLEEFDNRLRQLWVRRRSLRDSYVSSERAANASGLANSLTTANVLARIGRELEATTSKIKEVHVESAPACTAYVA